MRLFQLDHELPAGVRYRSAPYEGSGQLGEHRLWVQRRNLDAPGRLVDENSDLVSCAAHAEGMVLRFCDWTGGRFGLGDNVEIVGCILNDMIFNWAYAGTQVAKSFLDDALIGGLEESVIERCSFFETGGKDRENAYGTLRWSGSIIRDCAFARPVFDDDFTNATVVATRFFPGSLPRERSNHGSRSGAYFLRCEFTGIDVAARSLTGAVFEHCRFSGLEGAPIVDKTTVLIAPVVEGAEPVWFAECTVVRPGEKTPKIGRKRAKRAGIERPTVVAESEPFPAWWSSLPYESLRRHAAWWGKGEARDPNDPDRLVLEGVDLSDAILPTGAISGAVLRNCTLKNALVGRAENVELDGCNFEGAQISALRDSDIADCSFRGTRFVVAYLDRSRIRGCRFDNSVGRVSFREAKISDSHFDAASLVDSEFSRAVIVGCSLRGTTLADGTAARNTAVFATFDDCDFSEASLDETNFSSATLENCVFNRLRGIPWTKAGSTIDRGADVKTGITKLIAPIVEGDDPDWFADCEVVR